MALEDSTSKVVAAMGMKNFVFVLIVKLYDRSGAILK